ncbi:MAG: helix-turn-helix domain-containing protein [Nitrospinota bacterium]
MSNYYEIIGISIEATDAELEAAYLKAVSAYKEGSIAGYGAISEEYRKEILKNIETAFSTLKDPDKRREYDKAILQAGITEEPNHISQEEKNLPPKSKETGREGVVQLVLDIEGGEANKTEENKSGGILPTKSNNQTLDNTDASLYSELTHLKVVRELKGITLRDIANETKISVTYLKAIEEENFSEMPEDVYARGFIKAFAKHLGLNPEEFIASYRRHQVKEE